MAQTDRQSGVTGNVAVKAPCRVATTANITLSGLQTVDGVLLVADERVLVKDQTTTSENGIYVASSGAWSRATDFDGPRDVVKGTLVISADGTANAGYVWRVTTANTITIGASSITFAASSLGTTGATGATGAPGATGATGPAGGVSGGTVTGDLVMSGNAAVEEARANIAMHATTMDLFAGPNVLDGTGAAVTMTAIVNAPQAGARRTLYPTTGSIITNGATFAVQGGQTYTAVNGDKWEFEAITTSTYKVHITPKYGQIPAAGANIASAATIDLTAATGNTPRITGTTATSAFTMNIGQEMWLVADGAWPLTYHATTNKINGGVSYTCAAGDRISVFKDLSGIIQTTVFKADGTAVASGPTTGTTATTFTFDGTGGSTVSVTLSWQKTGSFVTLSCPGLSATSGTTSGALVSNTALPASIRPVTGQRCPVSDIRSAGGGVSNPGTADISIAGIVTIRRDATATTSWPNATADCGTSLPVTYTYFIG